SSPSGVVLSPNGKNTVSRQDRQIIEEKVFSLFISLQKCLRPFRPLPSPFFVSSLFNHPPTSQGLAVIDCSWAKVDEISFSHTRGEDRLRMACPFGPFIPFNFPPLSLFPSSLLPSPSSIPSLPPLLSALLFWES